jgi:hypothetical protein
VKSELSLRPIEALDSVVLLRHSHCSAVRPGIVLASGAKSVSVAYMLRRFSTKLTSEIRDYYCNSDFELLTPDAIHLATAIHLQADEFQTFDGTKKHPPRNKKYKRCGLPSLDGDVAGHKLQIVKPNVAQFELKIKDSEGIKPDGAIKTTDTKNDGRQEDTHFPVIRADDSSGVGDQAGAETKEKGEV